MYGVFVGRSSDLAVVQAALRDFDDDADPGEMLCAGGALACRDLTRVRAEFAPRNLLLTRVITSHVVG